MSAPPTAGTATPAERRRVATASAIGTTVEWYDYFIFGTASALIMGGQFFPELSEAAQLLAAFATFGVGFVARPLGSVLAGHFGDRIGRKSMMLVTIVLMGVATVGVGVLPTYDQIGIAAPIILVTLRLLQGLSAGGEWGGAALMAVEHAPGHRRGLFGCFSQIGTPAGLILANLVYLAVAASMSSQQFSTWGWRLPFLFSFVVVAIGLFIRLRVAESPVFRDVKQRKEESRIPLVEIFRDGAHRKHFFLAAGSFIANNALGYIIVTYLLSYGTDQLGVSSDRMLLLVLLGSFVWFVSIVPFAAWSDRVGRRRVYVFGYTLQFVWAIPFFLLIDTGSPVPMFIGIVVMVLALSASFGPQSALFAELFEPNVRYSGVAFSYNVGAILGGGFAPFIATALQTSTGSSLSVSGYIMGLTVISMLSILVIREPVQRRSATAQPQGTAADAAS